MEKKHIRITKILKGLSVGLLLIIISSFLVISYSKRKILYDYINEIDYSKLGYKEEIDIKHEDAKEYLEFNNIKIRDDFKDYKDKSIDGNLIKTKDENNKFSIKIITNALKDIGFEAGISKESFNKVLKDNYINSNIDLLNYALNNKNRKVKLLSSTKDINEVTVIKNTLVYYFDTESVSNIYLIKGDYNGVLIESDKNISIELLNKDTIYLLTIKTDKDMEYVKDLISTIVIN